MESTNVLVFILCAVLAYIIYAVCKNSRNYWKDCGIPYVSGSLPIFGNTISIFLQYENHHLLFDRFHGTYKNHSMIGFYNGDEPTLLIRDPELVKSVLQTNFSNFDASPMELNAEIDPLLSHNPFFSNGEAWLHNRKRLTYAFSGKKLKAFTELTQNTMKKFSAFLETEIKNNKNCEFELKDLFSKFTAEIVANIGFSVEGYSFHPDKRRAIYKNIGDRMFEVSLKKNILNTLLFGFPALNGIIGTRFVTEEVDVFMRNLAKSIISQRKHDSRNDFIQCMIDQEIASGNNVDEESMAAHSLSFFVDGFETSSITLSFLLYQLAYHPEVQTKAREEINNVLSQYNGEMTYEALKEMKYVDQVINESSRMYPALGSTSRKCTKDFRLEGSDGLSCLVKKGTPVVVSYYGLHKDERFWYNPEVFDPERFDAAKKQDIPKFCFLPFGDGPRSCVGMRMGMLILKSGLSTILCNYKVELSPKTKLPLKINPWHFLSAPVGGIWVNLKPLSKNQSL